MKKITKREIKSLINNLDYTKDEYVGFDIIDNSIELLHASNSKNIGYRIDGYLERWKTGEDTFKECIERIQEYMNDVIGFYNQGYKV
jgi:hypothetical protein